MLLQAFYSVRSERQLMERLEFDLLFRWFVGLGVDEPVWDHSTFSKNRDRLLEGAVAARFLATLLAQPKVKRLLSTEHFSVDGTDPSLGVDEEFQAGRRAERSVATLRWAQRRDRLSRRDTLQRDPCQRDRSRCQALSQGRGHGGEAGLSRPCPDGEPLRADRRRLPDASQRPCRARRRFGDDRAARRSSRRRDACADKGYDATDFVNELKTMNVRPHVAQNTTRRSAVDARTTRHPGYAASQRVRKRIEEAFGWMKTIGGMRRPMLRGTNRVGWAFTFAAAAYNLVCLPKLLKNTV
ncbi:transposase [Beijerinckia sp. L45]|uniref:transposase n=1 Tax=Beijerinckia sp. L45 TaxID=1641855 RepID=UPI001FED2FC2|nr:transposase [Beijerinckia sp. L45]